MSDDFLTSITIPTVPAPCLSANSRAHWATKQIETRRLYAIVRADFARQGYETVSTPVVIDIEIVWPLSKKGKLLDQDNAQSGGTKAIVDSLRPCACKGCRGQKMSARERADRCHAHFWRGVLPDDSPEWVKAVRATVRKGAEGPMTRIELRRAA